MRSAGIDIGSRTTKLVLLEGREIVDSRILPTTHDPLNVCRELLSGLAGTHLVATGYGRHLVRRHWKCEVISEIKAVSLGAGRLLPGCRGILDIGGQDTKAISLDDDGAVRKFEMNDKCAAGTGRFLEVMATALAFSMEEFIAAARGAGGAENVSSMCTVFAESEIISKVARGVPRDEIARGIHKSVARRALSMLSRTAVESPVLFAGGVALNGCMCELIEAGLGRGLHLPEEPQIVAAFGGALFGVGAATRE